MIVFQTSGDFLQASRMTGLCNVLDFYLLVIRQKGESQNDGYMKTKHKKVSEK